MKRRNFIKNTALITAGMASFPAIAKGKKNYTLVSIRGGSPLGMLDLGLDLLGGLDKFVLQGQKVLILPTLGWDRTPEQAANTNPKLLGKLVEMCYDAGSRGVYTFGQTEDHWTKAYKTSGIERMVKDAGAKILPGNKESYYKETAIDGEVLKHTKLHQLLFETDIIINVPVLKKTDNGSFLGAIQNLKSLVWKFSELPADQKNQALLDIAQLKKPVLNIIDADRVISKNAPAGKTQDDVSLLHTQILSSDIVAADTAAAKRLGLNPSEEKLLQLAQDKGIGTINLPDYRKKEIILKRQTRQTR